MMKKSVLLILFSFIVILGGCSMTSTDFDKETTERAKETANSYLENNYTDIESVEIEKVYRDEMGGMSISGTVNNKALFSIGIDEHTFNVRSIGEGKGFPEIKEECEKVDCDY